MAPLYDEIAVDEMSMCQNSHGASAAHTVIGQFENRKSNICFERHRRERNDFCFRFTGSANLKLSICMEA